MLKRRLAALALLLCARAFAQDLDLNASTAYVRRGFERSFVASRPAPGDPNWAVIQPAEARDLMMRDVDFPGRPPLSKWALLPGGPEEYTVVIPFAAGLELLNLGDPALYLAHVGQAWELYLNGELLRSEFLERPGAGYLPRSLRGAVIPLDKRSLRYGENVLGFRIYGDRLDDRTGFNMKGPYLVGSARALSLRNREYIDLMLIGIYGFFALYHLILFALRPQFKGYLYFGLATAFLSVYLASRSLAASALILNAELLVRVEYVALFLMAPCFFAFIESLLYGRLSKPTPFIAAAFAVLALGSQVFRREPFLIIWYFAALGSLVYYVGFVLGRSFVHELKARRATPKEERRGGLLFGSGSGTLLAGAAILALTVAADIYFVDSGIEIALSKYAFFAFLLAAATALAARFADTFRELESMTLGLERAVRERTASLSAAAEEKTRINERIAEANRSLVQTMDAAKRDMAVAVSVQKGFFPATPPTVADWDIALDFEPAAGVSGDFYDFYEGEGKLRGVVLGDVSGHGVASGLITVLAKNVFFRRARGRDGDPLGQVLLDVNRELVRELSSVDNYLTCAFMRFKGSRVEYVNAAHTDALYRKGATGEVVSLAPKGGGQDFKAPPLGREGLEASVKALAFTVAPGDILLLYTDCLTEGRDRAGREYGDERLRDALRRADAESAESVLASVMIDYRNFTGGAKRADDLTVIALMKR